MVIKKKSWGFCVSDNCSSGYFKVGGKLLMAWLGIGFDVQAEILWFVLLHFAYGIIVELRSVWGDEIDTQSDISAGVDSITHDQTLMMVWSKRLLTTY